MDDDWELLQLQKLQTSEVTTCDLNVNYMMAVGSSDKSLRVLEWKTGLGFVDLFYSPLRYHKYAVTSVRFSPKGTMLASSSVDGTAILIDVLTGSKIFTMVQYKTSNIKYCEFTFDSTKLITAADDGILCFWNLAHRHQIRHFRLLEDDYSLKTLAVSPDSEYLISLDSGNFLKIWYIGRINDNQPQSLVIKKNIHDNPLCCNFSPVKKISYTTSLIFSYYVATGGADCLVKVWNLRAEKGMMNTTSSECFKSDLVLLHVFKHDSDVLSVIFNSNGNHLVSTGLNNSVKLWKVYSGHCLKTLQGHARYVTCAAFSKDSILLATGSVDRTVIVWDLSKNLTLDSDLLSPCNVSCHFTHINITNYDSKNMEINQKRTYDEYKISQKLTFSSMINSVQFQKNDVLAVADRKTIEIWKRPSEKLTYELKNKLKEHKQIITHMDVSPCGNKTVSCSIDGIMILWELNMNLSYEMKTQSCTSSLRACKFSPDSKFIAAGGDDQKVYLWDSKSLEFIKIMQHHENAVTALAFTPDAEFLVSASCEGDILLQNLLQEKYAAKIDNAHDLGVVCCDFCYTAVSQTESSETNTNEWNKKNGAISLLATGGNDSLVKLWEVSVSKILILRILSGHGGAVNCVKFAPTKSYILASCSNDTTVRIWETIGKHCLHVLNYHQSAVRTCSFSTNPAILATGSSDNTVLIFKLTEKSCHAVKDFTQSTNKLLENWSTADTAKWFIDIGCPDIADKIKEKQLSGRCLLSLANESIAEFFGLENEKEGKKFQINISILKKSLSFPSDIQQKSKNAPHKFLCPITHQIMQDPVICADGYTFDRSSITEWFLSGKLISPITKESLTTTKLIPYTALKTNIYKYLNGNQN